MAAFYAVVALAFLWAAWPYLSVWWGRWDVGPPEATTKVIVGERELR